MFGRSVGDSIIFFIESLECTQSITVFRVSNWHCMDPSYTRVIDRTASYI